MYLPSTVNYSVRRELWWQLPSGEREWEGRELGQLLFVRGCVWLQWTFWRLFQRMCLFCDGWFTSAPAHIALSVQQFLTKNGTTPLPHPPYSPDLTLKDFVCFPRWKKSPKGNVLPMWKRWNKKKGRSTKRHQNVWVPKLFWTVEKTSQEVYRIRCRVLLRWLTFKHVKINTQFFINKFWGFWAPPHTRDLLIYAT